ncbi:ATP-binding protein [Candidatus Peregrinibacteria bacterium]|nr:ATP-binding protein [Candidatus Peregrinibacteria bacterium]
MKIQRALFKELLVTLQQSQKVLILYGARQVGKTTLVRDMLETMHKKILVINADEIKYVDVLSSRDLHTLKSLVSGYEVLFIDEAQRIPNIGINLKIMVDHLPGLKIVATGSSSFDLANKVHEPLTGRALTYTLYPISFLELSNRYNIFELQEQLEERLIYGSYPEIFSLGNNEAKKKYLEELQRAYLYKDVLEIATIKHSYKIRDLVKLLAFQIGSQVSLTELGKQLSMSKDAISHYIDLLEKAFVIFRLGGFSRNLRKEVSKMDKIYFYDLGIRNSVIDNLKPLKDRDDVGKLFENFLVLERIKCLNYKNKDASKYFWRTYTGAELDYLEEREGKLYGFEFTFNTSRKKEPKTWLEAYKNSSYTLIHKNNFLDFVL